MPSGYTYLSNAPIAAASVVYGSDTWEGSDPYHQFVVQLMMDLPGNLELDLVGRYVGSLPEPEVPAYFSLDGWLAWLQEKVELTTVGQNLIDD